MVAFRFRWSTALILAFFWCYAYFGALTHPKEIASVSLQLFLSVGLGAAFFWLVLRRETAPLVSLKIDLNDIGAWLFYFVLSLLLMAGELSHFPTADQSYHAERAQLHGLVATLSLSTFNNWPLRQALHFVSYLSLIGGTLAFWFVSRMKNRMAQATLAAGIFLIVRFVMAKAGGYSDPHPPLRLLPLWISTSLFGVTAFAFRLPTLLALSLLGAALFKRHKTILGANAALLFGLAAVTVPTVLLTSTMIEASIWTALAWTAVLFAFDGSFSISTAAAVAALATLMRQPGIAIYGAIAAYAIAEYGFKPKKIIGDKHERFLMVAAALTVGPFFLRTLVFGTPTTGLKNEAGESPARAWLFEALKEDRPLKFFVKDFGFLMLVPLLCAFCPYKDSLKKNHASWLATLALFAVGILMFFSIPPGLQGNVRYQAEYFFPFLLLGTSRLVRFERVRPYAFWALTLIFALNVQGILTLKDHNSKIHHTFDGQYESPTRYVYPYEKALSELHYAYGEMYLDEALYGAFPLVLAGATVEETKSSQDILHELWKSPQKWAMSCSEKITGQSIDRVAKIRVVLLQSGHAAIAELERLGWTNWKTYTDETYGAKLVALTRGSK